MHITVRDLTKSFDAVRANDCLNLTFAGGAVHGVLGENGAGKSTLMKLLAGFLRPDSGAIILDGQPLRAGDPAAALRAGVGMVHQEPLDIPGFTVLENVICAAPRWALPSRQEARNALIIQAGKLGFSLEPDTSIQALTVGQRQQLEIVRLLLCGARTLILDEPTTGITAAQVRALFSAVRQLVNAGNTVLFVSHKLHEVEAICDTVSVLRAGRVAGTGQMAMPQTRETLLHLMFGEALGRVAPHLHQEADAAVALDQPRPPAQPAWQVEHVTVRRDNLVLRDLDLSLPAGACVGLAGIEGSGQQLLLQLLAGKIRPERGRLHLNGHDLTNAEPREMRIAGVEYLPADRLAEGVVGPLSLSDHFALLQAGGAIADRRAAEHQARKAIADYAIKATPLSPLASLSGGNQQRAQLALIPDGIQALVCEQPTRGLDVASAAAVWQRLKTRRDAGVSVVFASADLDEILDHSDYVLVFFAGRVSDLLPRQALSGERLAELIGGVGFEG
ncbi:MAG: ATP-binding cassette domain-containing protein [Oscillochloris sp.]|nr:ATP-binding cassette domain-containing protein [Oscillochloris sp.]